MEGLETDDCLNEYAPYFAFLEELFALLMVDDLLVKVAIVRELHDDAG